MKNVVIVEKAYDFPPVVLGPADSASGVIYFSLADDHDL